LLSLRAVGAEGVGTCQRCPSQWHVGTSVCLSGLTRSGVGWDGRGTARCSCMLPSSSCSGELHPGLLPPWPYLLAPAKIFLSLQRRAMPGGRASREHPDRCSSSSRAGKAASGRSDRSGLQEQSRTRRCAVTVSRSASGGWAAVLLRVSAACCPTCVSFLGLCCPNRCPNRCAAPTEASPEAGAAAPAARTGREVVQAVVRHS